MNVLKKADKIIVDTKCSKQYYEKEFKADPNKIKVLYIEANKEIYSLDVKPIEKENKENFVVLYFGTILPLQGIDVILESAQLLKNNTNIQYIIIGNIKPKTKYTNVKFLPFMDERKLASYIKMADLCLVGHFNNEIEKAKRTIPCKAYICSEMNKKMILGKNKANLERFKEDNEKYYYVEMGNPNELAKKIYEIKKKTQEKGEIL